MRVLLLADTHVRDGGTPLDERVLQAAADADLILHAGDVTGAELLDRLGELAPVDAVLGNNDVDLADVLPERLELDVDGVSVAMVHDSGPSKGRPGRLRRWFPDADLVVFGHSHLPEDGAEDGLRIFNPGSPTQRRRAPTRSYGVLEVDGGRILDLRHEHLI
jgi:putative phosphoesterase